MYAFVPVDILHLKYNRNHGSLNISFFDVNTLRKDSFTRPFVLTGDEITELQ